MFLGVAHSIGTLWTLRTVNIDCLDYRRREDSLWLAPPTFGWKRCRCGHARRGRPQDGPLLQQNHPSYKELWLEISASEGALNEPPQRVGDNLEAIILAGTHLRRVYFMSPPPSLSSSIQGQPCTPQKNQSPIPKLIFGEVSENPSHAPPVG